MAQGMVEIFSGSEVSQEVISAWTWSAVIFPRPRAIARRVCGFFFCVCLCLLADCAHLCLKSGCAHRRRLSWRCKECPLNPLGGYRDLLFFIWDTSWKGVSLSKEAPDECGEADYLVFLWEQEATCLLIICTWAESISQFFTCSMFYCNCHMENVIFWLCIHWKWFWSQEFCSQFVIYFCEITAIEHQTSLWHFWGNAACGWACKKNTVFYFYVFYWLKLSTCGPCDQPLSPEGAARRSSNQWLGQPALWSHQFAINLYCVDRSEAGMWVTVQLKTRRLDFNIGEFLRTSA